MSSVSLNRLGLLLIIVATLATACESPTPETPIAKPIQPAMTATVPPTLTPQPTFTPTSTATSVATATAPRMSTATSTATATRVSTNTPTALPTHTVPSTPRATLEVKPTATKSAAASIGPVVSSKPTTLDKSVQQSLDAAYAVVGLLDQMKLGGGMELCAPLLADYQNIHNAPTYDPNGQPAQFQQAYNLYRQAIDLIDSRAAAFQDCGQGGGTIGGLAWSETRAALDRATQLLQQALDWAQRAVEPSASMTLPEAVARARLAAVAITGSMDRMLEAGSREACEPVVAEAEVLKKLPMFDVSVESAAVQAAYGLYRQSVDLATAKTVSTINVCAQGGGEIGTQDLYTARQAFRDIYNTLSQALTLLGQK